MNHGYYGVYNKHTTLSLAIASFPLINKKIPHPSGSGFINGKLPLTSDLIINLLHTTNSHGFYIT